MKGILGGAILVADIIAGMASPRIWAALHKPHPHLTGPIVLYVVLGLATLWVITSVVRRASGSGTAPASRPGYTQFGGRGR